MDLNEYDYTKRPYTSSKIYNVFPLSRNGFNQYISNDSYTHKYIKNKYDTRFIEKILLDEASQPKTFENFYPSISKGNGNTKTKNHNNEMIKKKLESKEDNNLILTEKDDIDLKNIENLKNDLLPHDDRKSNINNYINHDCFYNEKNKNILQEEKLKDMNYNNSNNKNYSILSKDNNLSEFHQESKRECYSSYNRVTKKTDFTKSTLNSKKNNLNKFLNLRNGLNKKFEKNQNVRWDTNYASNIELLKNNQKLFFDFNPREDSIASQSKKHSNGFESFNIPRLENIEANSSKPSFRYTQRIAKSCIGDKKGNNENNLIKYDNITKEIKPENSKETESNDKFIEKIKVENEKLKRILNTQTNIEFLNKGSMPKISFVATQPKLIIKKFGLGGDGKFLGGKYNPNNYQTGKGDDKNSRNYIGGVYLH